MANKKAVAIHAIHLGDGKGGVTVINPGQTFTADAEAVDELIDGEAAAKPGSVEAKVVAIDPLDHDGNGTKGGAKKPAGEGQAPA